MGQTAEWGVLLYRMLGSLLLVLALLLLIAYSLKRWGRFTGHSGGGSPIRILARQSLGPKQQLFLVEVMGHRLLLGASPEGIRLLSPLEKAPLTAVNDQTVVETTSPGKQFKSILNRFTSVNP